MNPNLPACWCIGVGIGFLSSAAMPAELAEKTPPNQAVVFLESLPEAKLKTLYLRCAQVSSQRLLPLDEAILCAMAGDVLMRRSFGGDFNALLAWWRRQRDEQ